MPKVIRRVINHRYTPIKPTFLVIDSVIDFDCFIKRYDDFVIIIESGTLITAELLHKVQQNENIYILKHDSEKVQIYKHAYGVNAYTISLKGEELASLDVMNLKKNIESLSNYEKKLELVYQTTASLLESVFEGKSEILPIEAIKLCVESIVWCIDSADTPIMPKVLHLMPDEYSTHHHSTNVAIFSTILGKSIGIVKSELIDLAYAGLMHDIGKIRIDQMLLLKPSSLEA